MITEATPTEHSVAAQIHTVTLAAYALEAEQISCTDFPPLRETLHELQQSPDRFLVFQQFSTIVGVLSFAPDTDPLLITRLVVNPAHLRQGIATALLAHLEQMLPPAARLTVSTAQGNAPAVSLYQRLGYTITGISSSPEGISLLHFTKTNDHNA